MEDRDIKENDDQNRVSLGMNLNLSLAPTPPSHPPMSLPELEWPLEVPPPIHSSQIMPKYVRPTQLSAPPTSQPLPPLQLSLEPFILPSSSSPLPEPDVIQRCQQQYIPTATPPLRSLSAQPEQLLPIQLYPLPDSAPPVAGHREVHGSSAVVGGGGAGSGGVRPRRSSVRQPLKQDPIPPPYPWATDKRATVHSLEYLETNGIQKINGQVCCKRCEEVYIMEVDLKKVYEVGYSVFNNLQRLHNRAPKEWLTPRLLDCDKCKQEACVKPVTDQKKKNINWLFLLATQSLGYCTLEQLKYFCKHTKSHRTGAKDRVLHDTYLVLLQQLYPSDRLASRRSRIPSSRS